MVDVTSFSTASTTPGTNQSISGTGILGTSLLSTADDSFRNSMALDAKFYADLAGLNTVSGTANAIAVTTPTLYAAYTNGIFLAFKNTSGPNTTAATLNLDANGAKAIRLQGDSALVGGEMQANGVYLLRYDTAYNSAAGAWVLLNPASVSNPALTSNDPFINFAIGTPTVAASALTIPFNGLDGGAFSATDTGYVNFRSATAGSGAIAQLSLTSAQSLVVPSGASLGSTNAIATTYALAAFNNAGSIIYGIINPLTLPLVDGIATTTLLSGTSTSAGVWYTTSALTSKAYTIIGFITATEVTAGTWATAPSTVQVGPAPATTNAISSGPIKLGTSVPTTSGTSIDYATVIPPWANVVQVILNGVSTNGTSNLQVQLMTSAGAITSGYLGQVGGLSAASPITTGIGLTSTNGASSTRIGAMTLSRITGNTWVGNSQVADGANALNIMQGSGSIALASALTGIRLTTVNGTDAFDAGTVNVTWQ